MREKGNRELALRRETQRHDEEEVCFNIFYFRSTNDSAQVNFKSLVTEKVKDPYISWKDALKILDSDPRFKTNHLTRDEKDRIFNDHCQMLIDLRLNDFKALLAVILYIFRYQTLTNCQETTFEISMDWKHAKDLIRNDRRYLSVITNKVADLL